MGTPTRRRFLRGLFRDAATAAALTPFLPLLGRELEASAGVPPRRLVLIWASDGPWLPDWTPTGNETGFTLSPILAPFARHRNKMMVLSGVNKVPGDDGEVLKALGSARRLPGSHTTGCNSTWTAELCLPGDFADPGDGSISSGWPAGPSVDQYIAGRLKVKTLELGVQVQYNRPASRTIYAGASQPKSPENDPYKLFDGLFGGLTLDTPARDRIRAQKQSVIDLVRADLARIRPKVGAADLQKIDVHLGAIRDIELTLDNQVQCSAAAPGPRLNAMANDNVPKVFDAQIALLATAFSCDVAPIASLQISDSICPLVPHWVGIDTGVTSTTTEQSFSGADIHSIGHHLLDGDPAAESDARAKNLKANIWFSEKVATLLDRLFAPGAGLDNTLVVYDRELAGPSGHSTKSSPFVMFEGGTYFRPGRFIKYPGGGEFRGNYSGSDQQPHTKLLVSLCHAMGLEDVAMFGNPAINTLFNGTGPLPNLR